jgi:hypothetical protein
MNMKNLLLTSVAFVCVALTPAFSASTKENTGLVNADSSNIVLQMLADNDGSGGGDDGADHDSNDDHGGASGNDDDGDDDKSDNESGSRKARIPGGSGCDSAQDRAEHPKCNAG